MAKTEAEVFERIRDALSPFGISSTITDRRGSSMSIRFTKAGRSGQRTLHVGCRKEDGDPRTRQNQISDAKRLCREAGWIPVEAVEPERVPVSSASPVVAEILNRKPEPALGAALRETLMSSTNEETPVPSPPPVAKFAPVSPITPPPPPPSTRVITGKLGLYPAKGRNHPAFMAVVPDGTLSPLMLEHFWDATTVRHDMIVLEPSTRATRKWSSYTRAQRAIRIDVDKRSPLFIGGGFGMTDCLMEVSAGGNHITIIPPDKSLRRAILGRRPDDDGYDGDDEQPNQSRNPIEALREAKETINALRREVPGLVIRVTAEGDIEFTLTI